MKTVGCVLYEVELSEIKELPAEMVQLESCTDLELYKIMTTKLTEVRKREVDNG